MRGVEREERKVVTQLLSQGIPINVIVKQMNIPMTTVCEWAKALRKEQRSKGIGTLTKTDTICAYVRNTETKISNIVSQYVDANITDDQWFEVEQKMNEELHHLVDLTIDNLRNG